jgi:hypothetical protein
LEQIHSGGRKRHARLQRVSRQPADSALQCDVDRRRVHACTYTHSYTSADAATDTHPDATTHAYAHTHADSDTNTDPRRDDGL